MAIKRLEQPVEWGYDDVSGEILIRMRLDFPEGETDPAEFRPVKEAIVRLAPVSINVVDI